VPLDEYWAEIDRLHRPRLTTLQWEVIRLTLQGLSGKQIAGELDRDPSSVRQLRTRALRRVFEGSWIEPSDASLGAWYARHHDCCDSAA